MVYFVIELAIIMQSNTPISIFNYKAKFTYAYQLCVYKEY